MRYLLRVLLIAFVIIIALFFGIDKGLKAYTYHNRTLIVPDLTGLNINQAIDTLIAKELRFEVIDSSQYFDNIPAHSIIEQIPSPLSQVKRNRRIFLTLNRANQPYVSVPDLIQVTKRNAQTILKATGLELGNITYVDDIGRDMVLQIIHKGKPIEVGSRIQKTSRIDLVLGNGNQ